MSKAANKSYILERYFYEISQIPLLTPEKEKELATKIQKQGDQEALKKLIEANLRFVISVAKNFTRANMPLEDLIGAGNIGLIKAAKKFDPNKNLRFITFAKWTIKGYIIDYIDKHSTIVALPIKRPNILWTIKKLKNI